MGIVFRSVLGAVIAIRAAAQLDAVSFIQTVERSQQPPAAGEPPTHPWDHREEQATHIIRGTPVYGYDASIHGGGKRVTWIIVAGAITNDAMLESFCMRFDSVSDDGADVSRCEYSGHPSHGGLPMVVIRATEEELTAMPSMQAAYIEVDRETKLIAPVAVEQLKAGLGPSLELGIDSWGLDRINQRHGLDHEERYIDSAYASKGAGIVIFSVDTGVNVHHPEFGGRAIAGADFTLSDYNDKQHFRVCSPHGDTACAADRQGHGTHTAGIAASSTFGVAKEATVHAVKVLGDNGSGQWSWFLSGIDWVVQKVKRDGIRQSIITASLGGLGPTQTVQRSIQACNDAGISVVVAAGNENDNACKFLPSAIPSAITVGSINEFDARSYFSNFGKCVDVFAPGSHIISLDKSEGAPISMSGTSMAAPFVAGAAAVILSNSPSMAPAGLQASLGNEATTDCIRGLARLKAITANKILFIGLKTETTDCMSRRVSPTGAEE